MITQARNRTMRLPAPIGICECKVGPMHDHPLQAIGDSRRDRRIQAELSFPMRRRDEATARGVWEFWLYGFRIRAFRLCLILLLSSGVSAKSGGLWKECCRDMPTFRSPSVPYRYPTARTRIPSRYLAPCCVSNSGTGTRLRVGLPELSPQPYTPVAFEGGSRRALAPLSLRRIRRRSLKSRPPDHFPRVRFKQSRARTGQGGNSRPEHAP